MSEISRPSDGLALRGAPLPIVPRPAVSTSSTLLVAPESWMDLRLYEPARRVVAGRTLGRSAKPITSEESCARIEARDGVTERNSESTSPDNPVSQVRRQRHWRRACFSVHRIWLKILFLSFSSLIHRTRLMLSFPKHFYKEPGALGAPASRHQAGHSTVSVISILLIPNTPSCERRAAV